LGQAAVPIILGISAAVAAGGTAYQIHASEEASNKADAQARKQEAHQSKALEEQKKQQETLEAKMAEEENVANRNTARHRQRALAAGAQGRSDTILTSPLGATGPIATAGKTLLGH